MRQTPLLRAVNYAGGQAALARLIGTSQGHVWNWLHREGRVPAEYVLKIEAAVKGTVTRTELRPDLYPHEAA